jgi:4-alpha-glucanotransferase
VLVPLFSIPSRSSWGIGEIGDLPRLARWLSRAGLDFVQLLPVNEMEGASNSPYAAVSAMAIDPVFLTLDGHPDFVSAGGEAALPKNAAAALAVARAARRIDYAAVREAKDAALEMSYEWFDARGASAQPERAAAFDAFRAREAWWLDDYALFRALHAENGGRYWREWDEGVRDRHPDAIDAARLRLGGRMRCYAYLQWIAGEQWNRCREDCGTVGIFGDFPFMVSGHSADVWARQQEFRLDASVGVPPDAGSPEGQDWGLPACRWDVCAAGGFEWLRQRAARSAALFDGFRVDHLVGFYRTYVRERSGAASFVPAEEAEQRRQGEAVLQLMDAAGARIVAEDLGTVPDFVRDSLTRLRIAGLKVLRWERHWHEPGQPFRDPSGYPADSMATTGTHDTETLAGWWGNADSSEREACALTPTLRAAGLDAASGFSPQVRDALLGALFSARSDLVLVPLQDVFGWPDRINDPAADSSGNWTWRLPWPVEDLLVEPEAVERASFLSRLAARR